MAEALSVHQISTLSFANSVASDDHVDSLTYLFALPYKTSSYHIAFILYLSLPHKLILS